MILATFTATTTITIRSLYTSRAVAVHVYVVHTLTRRVIEISMLHLS